ncbi:MAG: hypothetical protein HY513_01760 [Candidatus Aenigmarchaeota archaeon]|nr:hypothetical protein [Candidatus Aenigmarchaeota archaeon]
MLLLVLLVFTAGCAGIPNIFGSNIIDLNTVVNVDGQRDILAIKSIETIPNSPVLPSSRGNPAAIPPIPPTVTPVVLSFLLENQDKINKADNVVVDLFDAPVMREDTRVGGLASVGPLCNSAARPCQPDKCYFGDPNCVSIFPGEQKQINFFLVAPFQDEIVNIRTTARMDFKVTYQYDASFTYLIPIIGYDEVLRRQVTGEKLSVQQSKAHSSGPVEIDAELLGSPYALSGQTATLLFKIKNAGSGQVAGSAGIPMPSKIPPNALEVTFDSGLRVTSPNGDFNCPIGGGAGGAIVCRNAQAIEIFKGESRRSLIFNIVNANQITEPFKTFHIIARIDNYLYELKNNANIEINSFQNI